MPSTEPLSYGITQELTRVLDVLLLQGSVVVVNAAAASDLDVFCAGMLRAERGGLRMLCRTAASFVSSRMGISRIPPLGPKELNLHPGRVTRPISARACTNCNCAPATRRLCETFSDVCNSLFRGNGRRGGPGGLIVVGSYVPKTTAQVSCCRQHLT